LTLLGAHSDGGRLVAVMLMGVVSAGDTGQSVLKMESLPKSDSSNHGPTTLVLASATRAIWRSLLWLAWPGGILFSAAGWRK